MIKKHTTFKHIFRIIMKELQTSFFLDNKGFMDDLHKSTPPTNITTELI